ncbi:MAG: hypothetical protein ACYC4R_08290 [Anaerolineae bacterium]
MLNIVNFMLTAIDEYTMWLYLGCLFMVLLYIRSFIVARRDRENTVFTIEKEVAAHREGRAMSGIGAMLGVVVVITGMKYYLVPSIDLSAMITPTPTLTLAIPTLSTLTPTPTTAVEVADETRTPRVTPTVTPTEAPTALPVTPTPAPPPASACADPNVCISSPGMNATISGQVAVTGSADNAGFQFFKVELGVGEEPGSWSVIGDLHRSAVHDGVLESFNTAAVPNGVYWLSLTVVDQTGNWAPPYRVRVVVQN